MTELPFEIAQAKLGELVDSLGEGDVVILTRDAKPVAKLVGQPAESQTRRQPGSGVGKLTVLAEDDEHLRDFTRCMP